MCYKFVGDPIKHENIVMLQLTKSMQLDTMLFCILIHTYQTNSSLCSYKYRQSWFLPTSTHSISTSILLELAVKLLNYEQQGQIGRL